MEKKRMIMIGEKESFIVKVMIKKVQEAGVDCSFARWTVNDVNAILDSDVALVAMYLGEDEHPSNEILRFLNDKLLDMDEQMMVIGSGAELDLVLDNIPGDMIYKVFRRPVNNEEYVASVTDLFGKIESGEFKKTILVVDDDPNYLSLVREWLKSTYKVAMANSGLQAIKWLGKHKADLILLDYEMPVTTGPQVLEMLRSDEETKGIPVMFLTGKSDKQSVMSVVALKPENYFLKSIQKQELLDKLAKYFAKNR